MADIKKWEDYDTIICPDGQEIDMQALLDDQERAKAALVHLCPFFGEFISTLSSSSTRFFVTKKVLQVLKSSTSQQK